MIRLALVALAVAALLAPARAETARMPMCGSAKRVTCVVDGDTVWLKGEKIRLAGIDAPEKTQPRCAAEAALAFKAADRLAEILGGGEPTIVRSGTDRYGRTLASLSVAGKDIGAELVAAGLARLWQGHKATWCGD